MVFQMKELKRSEQREQAFAIIFERIFNDVPLDELMDNALLARDFELCDYAQKTAEGVAQNLAEIDAQIEQYAVGWKKQRFSRVALAILRLAVYEMKFSKDVPVAVVVNEAVELAKKFATPADASFINGILGSISRAQSEVQPAEAPVCEEPKLSGEAAPVQENEQ